MADPLSMFANEEEDIEKVIELSTGSENTDNPVKQDPAESSEQIQNNKDQNEEDKNDGQHSVVVRQSSTCSDQSYESDLLAQIDSEMNLSSKDLDVTVENPEKVVKTMESYIAFTVKSKTTRSEFEDPEYCVKRRYNDFLWLRQQLVDKYPHVPFPPLPEKHSLTIDRFDKEFLKFRQAALHRLLNRLTDHPEITKDEMLKSFLTLEYAEFQTYKKKGTGLLSRVTKSITTIGGSYMLKSRSEEYTKINEYAQSFGDVMGACDRITTRLQAEKTDYLNSVNGYVAAFINWREVEKEALSPQLDAMSTLMQAHHDDYKLMVDEMTHKTILPFKEYNLYADVLKGVLASRDALQHEMEIITEELVKCADEKKMLDDGTTGAGLLGRNMTEEAVQAKKDKLTARITELESAHSQCKERLEERNEKFRTEMDRWHTNQKADMKEVISGLAARNIEVYDKHISSLEKALSVMKSYVQ